MRLVSLSGSRSMILTRIIVPIVDERELAPTEEVDEVTTLGPNDTHDDGEPDPIEDVGTVPTLIPTDPIADEGELAPTEEIEEATTLVPNNSPQLC